MPDAVTLTDVKVSARDGVELLARRHAKAGSAPGSAVFSLHGGGK